MKAEIEFLVGVIRCGENYQQHGDPYEFSATVVIQGEDATIYGATGNFSKAMFLAIKTEFQRLGTVKRVHWERLKNNRVKILTINI